MIDSQDCKTSRYDSLSGFVSKKISNTRKIVGYDCKTAKGYSKKTNSIFKDIVQKGGREVNPISKN